MLILTNDFHNCLCTKFNFRKIWENHPLSLPLISITSTFVPGPQIDCPGMHSMKESPKNRKQLKSAGTKLSTSMALTSTVTKLWSRTKAKWWRTPSRWRETTFISRRERSLTSGMPLASTWRSSSPKKWDISQPEWLELWTGSDLGTIAVEQVKYDKWSLKKYLLWFLHSFIKLNGMKACP